MTAPVIIVGSGPVGSVAALALGQAGIDVLLLEKESDLPVDLRASTFHPPSLDMLDDLGIADEMVARGLKAERYQYRDRSTGEVAEFDMSVIANETRHPFRLQLEQYELTRIIRDRLKTLPNVQQRFDAPVTSVKLIDDGVQITANGEQLQTPFLIGADGASSVVRQELGIEYGGFTYDEKFVVASTPFAFEDVFDRLSYVNYFADADEWCVILRTNKQWRVLWPTDPQVEESVYLSEAWLQQRLQTLHAKPGAYEIGHRTLYHVHQRVADSYVKGRAILCGDAAHINNPLGGMGMNGGVHDAVNLAGKLIRIIKDGGDADTLLALYDRQRRTIASKFIQEHTIRNKQLMESNDRDVQLNMQKWLMETASDPVKAKAFVRERAMIDSLHNSLAIS